MPGSVPDAKDKEGEYNVLFLKQSSLVGKMWK